MLDSHSKVLLLYRAVDRLPPYAAAVRAAGIEPVLMQPGEAIPEFSGLVLTGGSDVDPALYGQPPHAETDPPDRERDGAELELLRRAFQRDLPVLAICRGQQMLNVFLGGTLIQHLPSIERHQQRLPDKSLPAHPIAIQPEGLLGGIARADSWQVNSRHHQAIDTLGAGLKICAADPEDETIEAVYAPGRRFVLGVQWHPEDQIQRYPQQLEMFRAFAAAISDS